MENWEFGDTFYFSELAAYLYNELSPDVLSVIIVPKLATSNFGSLFQIQSQRDEILISAATVNDIEVIDVITANSLQASGNVVNTTTVNLASESVSANGSATSVATSTARTASSTSSASYGSSSGSSSSSSSSSSSGSSSSSSSSSSGGGGYGY